MERMEVEVMKIFTKTSRSRKPPRSSSGGFIEYKNRRLCLRRADCVMFDGSRFVVTSMWICIEGQKPSVMYYPIRRRKPIHEP